MSLFQALSLSVANDGFGDPLRDGGEKINSNFLLAEATFNSTSANLNNDVGSLQNLINVNSTNLSNNVGSLTNLINVVSLNLNNDVGSLQNLLNITSANLNNHVGSYDNLFNVFSVWVDSLGAGRVLNTRTVAYTLVLTDKQKVINMDCASPVNLTIPLNAAVAFPVGTQIDLIAGGPGQITVVPSGTMYSSSGFTKLARKGSAGFLLQMSADYWVLAGDLG